MASSETPNTLVSTSNLVILDLLGEGYPRISGFPYKSATFGDDPLLSTYYDDVVLRNLDGSYNYNVSGVGYRFDYLLGTPEQTGIPGYQKVETLIPLPSNTRIATPVLGAPNGAYKTVSATINTVTFPDADTIKVTMRVPALFSQDDNGNTNGYEITYAVDIALNNGSWVEQEQVTIRGKCTQPYLQTRTYVLPKTTPPLSYYEWKVRVRRVSTNILSIKTQNELFVESISVISSSMYGYPNSVLVGTTISADQFSSVPARSYELCGLLVPVPNGYTPTTYLENVPVTFTRQCDIDEGNRNLRFTTQTIDQTANVNVGGTMSGPGIDGIATITDVGRGALYTVSIDQDPTLTAVNQTYTFYTPTLANSIIPATYPTVWTGDYAAPRWTDNPAFIFNDLLTNPVHGLGEYVPSGSVDKWTLYQIAQYCDQMVDDGAGGLEPRFTCNVVIQEQEQAYSVLLNLASTFRGMLYYANGTIHATQTSDKSPVYAFTNANVIGGAFDYPDTSANTRSTVAKVKWIDPSNQYRENIEYIEDIDGIARYGYQVKEMTAFACTSKGQAYRLGSWTLQTERLLTETVSFQTSLEGLYLMPGDAFGIYDNFRNNRPQGGRITAFNAGRSLITLDRPVTLDPGVTYSLTCIVPKAVYDAPDSITGSNQIDLIRNSQIESFRVTNSAGVNASLTVAGQFSTGIYPGSPFVLSASGDPTGIFRNASFYTCLSTAEIEPGRIEILGLQANSGINFVISTGYTVVDNPPNSGDPGIIQPPSNLSATWVTGIRDNNSYYSNINLSWNTTPSSNVAGYTLSGQTFGFGYSGFSVVANSYSFPQDATGLYNFRVAAFSIGGVESSFITTSITIQAANPFGQNNPLSGVFIYQDADPILRNAAGYSTGFLGTRPGLQWRISTDTNGDVPWSQFVTGYRIRMSGLGGGNLLTQGAIYISGGATDQYLFPDRFLYTGFGASGATRGLNFVVEPMDEFGSITSGTSIKINNPAPRVPANSGFVGFNGGLSYNVTPNADDLDISGVYIWTNASPSFVPTPSNVNYVSENLAGFAPNSFTGNYWNWFSLVDTFGPTGCAIWGPMSGNANSVIINFNNDITNEINNAFNLLSGNITSLSGFTTGADYAVGLRVDGLSGQVVGSVGGVVNTALNVRVQTVVVSASGALSQTIDAVSARVQLTGQQNAILTAATGASMISAIATTGGAIASQIVNLGATTTGLSASIRIGANAFVTGGSANGFGGVAVAQWGFELNANGKVVGMKATSSTWGNNGVSSTNYGTIVFSGAALQSDTYVKGANGWFIDPSGNVEFGNAIVRGTFTGGAGASTVSANSTSFFVGNPNADRFEVRTNPFPAGFRSASIFNDNSVAVAVMRADLAGNQGEIICMDSVGTNSIEIVGEPARITALGSSSLISGALIQAQNIDVGGGAAGNSAGIKYLGSAGGNRIAFHWDGLNVKVFVDGTSQGTIPNP